MHYAYFNGFHNYCHDFAGNDEIIFMIALCVLPKIIDPMLVFGVNTAIAHFRDNGRALHIRVYADVEAAWGSCTRGDPPLAMRFVNDPVDDVPSQQASRIRRQKLWNAIIGELRFNDRVDVDEDAEAEVTVPLPTRSELHRLMRRVIGPSLWNRLERALGKNLITPEVLKQMATLPLGEGYDLPNLELELDRQRRVLDPTYLVCGEDAPEDLRAGLHEYLELVGV